MKTNRSLIFCNTAQHCHSFLYAFLLFIFSIVAATSHAETISSGSQSLTHDDYQRVTTLAYRELATSASFKLPQADLSTLINEVEQADKEKNSLRVIVLVAANMNIIQKNSNAKELQGLTEILLQYHATGIAGDILNIANTQGDVYTQAKENFEFAKYEAKQNHWDKAISWLKKIDITNELSKENGDEADILYGAALQYKKKHREALAYYGRVKSDSALYSVAQLNSALAYIRQDWWTDAQVTIEHALNSARKEDEELVNRLHTILGFSQLQQGFYRNARESFRNVKIKSSYANRALSGVGMASLNQEDFVGAINAFNQLKNHSENDVSVAHAYLLHAYALTKIKQNAAASTSYTEAIAYYEQKTNHIENLLQDIKMNNPDDRAELIANINTNIGNEELELNLFSDELKALSILNGNTLTPNIKIHINTLYNTIFQAYLTKANEVITKKQLVFNSYLNQSRFGLTRLFDANN